MRRWWAALLCLALLWSGGVLPVLAAMPCGMAMPAADDGGATAGEAPALPDCCLDADTAARSGQTCQPGTPCAVVMVGLPMAGATPAPMPTPAGERARAPENTPTQAPPGAVWRPPTPRG